MRRLLMLVAISSTSMSLTGCTIERGPNGPAIHAASWHLQDGTYRPWNDVNSGTLSRWRSRSNPTAGMQLWQPFPYSSQMFAAPAQ
jgi:hypothetical protein